jgi:hypothetical protein
MRPQSKEYPVKRFIPISRSNRLVQLYWYTPLPLGDPDPSWGNQCLTRPS